ncbi:MAG: DUF4337 domain-containing protein [Nitrospiraceae bacterium]|nr:DUF4337 domain-containing protein [Nitrospiraceae bacterium]
MAEIELPKPEEIEEVRSKRFTRRVAFTTAIFAVMLAITSLGGNNAMKGMLLSQQQASDQWAFYQSKVIREHLYRLQKMQLEAGTASSAKAPAADLQRVQALIKDLAKEEARYNSEKKTIEQEARRLERERDINNAKDPYFDYAEVMLQIAIVMASISILSLSRPVFYFALAAATVGSLLCLNGYLLVVHLPFLH